jgi:hypothetical protein
MGPTFGPRRSFRPEFVAMVMVSFRRFTGLHSRRLDVREYGLDSGAVCRPEDLLGRMTDDG